MAVTTHIALLRGINVGGHQKVAMTDLRDVLTKLKFAGVRTLLQSGNVVFRRGDPKDRRTDADIERSLEDAAEKRFGFRTDFFVRTAAEWNAIIAKNPFRKEAEADPGRLIAMILKDAPAAKQIAALEQSIVGRERVRAEGRLLYIVYPDGVGASKFTNALIDRKLETRGTGRNWNTVLKLAAMCAE
jgi:uncharacterized protein (DUF1697 family)